LAVAGAAINELIDGIPRAQNPGIGGDMQGAGDVFRAIDLKHPQEMQMAWDAGVDRVIAKIRAIPGLEDIIRLEAGRREENLPVQMIMTDARLKKIIERAKALRDAAEPKRAEQLPLFQEVGRNAPGVSAPGGPGAREAVAGREGQGAAAGARLRQPPLKPFTLPKITATFEVIDAAGDRHRVEILSVNKPDALKQLKQQFPRFRRATLVDIKYPQIEQIPFSIKGSRPKGFSR
jgi:hypothetical protein